MKKRDKKLSIAKETLYELEKGRDLMAVQGGMTSCGTSPSTAGGSVNHCC